MGNESGEWIIYGLDRNDPGCIRSADEAMEYIDSIGFLPLFKNDIPGLSLEEHTAADDWWTGDPMVDPWEWRAVIARQGRIAYGKFFDNKAGFISQKWLPYFVNYRRDGYDFDALWDDEKASMRQKKVMDQYADDKSGSEYYSSDLKQLAGFGKDGEKGFDSIITNLQMQTYLCVRDFRQKKNKKGQGYGWAVALYSTPEHIFGKEFVTSSYSEDPVESGKKIAKHIMGKYPDATASQIKRIIGIKAADIPEKKEKNKKDKLPNYPENILKALKLNIKSPSEDQLLGLEFAINQLKESYKEVLLLHYKSGLTYKETGMQTGRSSSACAQISRMAIQKLQNPKISVWITEGQNGHYTCIHKLAEKERLRFVSEGKTEQAELMPLSPRVLACITSYQANLLENAGINTLGILREFMKNDFWTRTLKGIGPETGKKITLAMYRNGLIDENFEAYKEAMDRNYLIEKYRKLHEI